MLYRFLKMPLENKKLIIISNAFLKGETRLALSGPGFLSYRNQYIDLLCKSVYWFLYDGDLSHDGVKGRKYFYTLPL